MDVSSSSWLLIALALAGANLPFLNDRLLAVLALRPTADGQARRKPLAVRLLEMLLMYGIVGALAFALEASMGNAFEQTWEFYAVTGCLFLVLAFPGFVVRYLRKRHH